MVYVNGSQAVNPSDQELASRIGVKLEAAEAWYEVVFVGGVPPGLAAAICAAREGIETVASMR
ncbi:MAG TPA: hypothetical protein VGL48_02115 [Acidimicrobiales bacterium]|jgi:thioredoxin reductase (NADPH)